jgi:ribokinase
MTNKSESRIIVLGRVSMALTVNLDSVPKPKEQITAKRITYIPGGKGSNQAVAANKLGGKASFVTCIGADKFGADLLSFLKSQGLDTSFIKTSKDTQTGTSIVMIDNNSDNTIISIPGSERELHPSDMHQIKFNKGDIAVTQLALAEEVLTKFLKKAKDSKATTILNCAPQNKVSKDLLKLADYIILNEREAAFFAGNMAVSQNHLVALDYAKKIRLREDQVIVVTLGSKGSVTLNGHEVIRIPGIKVDAIDTTGAGDTFVGAFATALSESMGLKQGLSFANKAAALCVQKHGAATSAPTRKEVDDMK